MEKFWRFLWLVLCASVLPRAMSRSSGAPAGACTDLVPQHSPSVPQVTPSPYKLSVTNMDGSAVTNYSGGETLKGMVSKVYFQKSLAQGP